MANGITNGILESAILDPTGLYDGKMLVNKFTQTNFGGGNCVCTRVLELEGEIYAPIWNISSNPCILNWCKYNQSTNQWDVISQIQTTSASSPSGTACTSITYFKNKIYVIFARINSDMYVDIKSSADGLTWADELTNFTTDEGTNPFCDIISNDDILTAVIGSRARIRFWTTDGTTNTLFNTTTITTTGSSSNSNKPYLFYGDDGVCYAYIVNTSAIYKVENVPTGTQYDNLQIDAFAKVVSWNNRLYISSTSGLIIYKASDKSKETINIEGQWVGIGSDNTGVWGLSEDTVYKIDASQNVKKYKTDYAFKQLSDQILKTKIVSGCLLFIKNNLLSGLLVKWSWKQGAKSASTVLFFNYSNEGIRDWALKNNTWDVGLPALLVEEGMYVGTDIIPLKLVFRSDIKIQKIEILNTSQGGSVIYTLNYGFERVFSSSSSDVTHLCTWGDSSVSIKPNSGTNIPINYANAVYTYRIYGTYIGNGLNQ